MAAQIRGSEAAEAVIGRVEVGMLAGQDQARPNPERRQGARDGSKLYGFGTGTDDQPYVGKTQSSP